MRCSLIGLLAVAVATPAAVRADVGELEAGVTTSVGLLQRHGRMNRGAGAGARGSYGLRDWLAVDLAVDCDRFQSLAQDDVTRDGQTGRLFYDTTRCSAVPSAVLRIGARYAATLAIGAGYRFERRSARELVSTDKILLARLDSVTDHQVVGSVRAAFEYRIFDWLAASVFARAATDLVGSSREVDAAGGVTASVYIYP